MTAARAGAGIAAGAAVIFLEPDAAAVPEGAAGLPSVAVPEGGMVALTGPPGSGTSALLAAAAGVRPLPGLSARVGGRDLGALPHRRRRAERRALRLLYLPQEPALISNLTVLENILLPIRYLGERPEREAGREARDLLEASGLIRDAGRLPSHLSAKDVRTVALFRGFLRRPRAAILDEPLAGLDEPRLAGILPLVRSALAGKGGPACAILAAAADPSPLEALGARIVVVEKSPSEAAAGSGPAPGAVP